MQALRQLPARSCKLCLPSLRYRGYRNRPVEQPPPPPPGPSIALAPTSLLPGRADFEGTSRYAQRFGDSAGPGHFRTFPAHDPAGKIFASSLGLGTYLGQDTDEACLDYEQAVTKALTLGFNVLDTAINYRNMRSERAIGRALANVCSQGLLKRNEVIICTKGGFLTFEVQQPPNPRAWVDETYVKTGMSSWAEFAGGCHSMSPAFLKNQVDRSCRNLGVEVIDVYYIHTPEMELGEVTRNEFNTRIRRAFAALEEVCAEGKITVYGISTWSGFRVSPGSRSSLSLEELVNFARDAGGENHHFRVAQLPFNLRLREATSAATQFVRGRRMPMLEAAKELGVTVVTSAPLMQTSLCSGLPAEIRDAFSELGDNATDAHRALQFVRRTRGIMTSLIGMQHVAHVEENAHVIRFPAARG